MDDYRLTQQSISLEALKSAYVADGLSAIEIADKFYIDIKDINKLIQQERLADLRKAFIIQGLQKIQNVQIHQTNRLLELETNFKKMRIIQLEAELEGFLAYYNKHSDFYKRHPTTKEILKNPDGIPMQLKLPQVSKEIAQLKESVTMSEGIRKLLHRLDEIINTPKPAITAKESDAIDITTIDAMFAPRKTDT